MFISETIEVKRDKTDKRPVEFIWRGKPRYIRQIVAEWQDWGFASGVHKADWRQRRHRNYYRVKCDDGCIYEIYLDRKTAQQLTWYLYRTVEDEDKIDK